MLTQTGCKGDGVALPNSQIHCLAHANHRNAQEHVVADFGRLSHSVAAAMRDPLAHTFEQTFDFVVFALRAANHKCERSIFGADNTAAHRCIDKGRPLARDQLLHLYNNVSTTMDP